MFRAESSPQYITDRRLLLRTIRKSWKEGERERGLQETGVHYWLMMPSSTYVKMETTEQLRDRERLTSTAAQLATHLVHIEGMKAHLGGRVF